MDDDWGTEVAGRQLTGVLKFEHTLDISKGEDGKFYINTPFKNGVVYKLYIEYGVDFDLPEFCIIDENDQLVELTEEEAELYRSLYD